VAISGSFPPSVTPRRSKRAQMVASAGELVRATFDQSMLEWAQKLGLRCELVEHPHLLATQVAGLEAGAVVSLGVERCGAAELSQAS
jgi:hypothetical protein